MSAPAATTATPAATGPSNSRALACVAYILTWVTGLIIYFVADKSDKYARWHAVQAIALGIVATIGWILFGVLRISILSTIWGLLVLVAVIILAIKAYQGEKMRAPVLADFADKYA